MKPWSKRLLILPKNFEAGDIRGGIVAAISIKVQEPVLSAQTKTKPARSPYHLMGKPSVPLLGISLGKLDNYLHKHPETADALQDKIQRSERERKGLKRIQKIARERAKKKQSS